MMSIIWAVLVGDGYSKNIDEKREVDEWKSDRKCVERKGIYFWLV